MCSAGDKLLMWPSFSRVDRNVRELYDMHPFSVCVRILTWRLQLVSAICSKEDTGELVKLS
eukprot:827667-Amphidinium_carterae.2